MPSKVQSHNAYDDEALSITGDNDNIKTPQLPVKEIPGDYGVAFFSPIRDRLDYYYFQGEEGFFQSRVCKYGWLDGVPSEHAAWSVHGVRSEVVWRPRAKSFPVLFDMQVEKKDVFTERTCRPVSLTGGYGVCSYLDPSSPTTPRSKHCSSHSWPLASRASSNLSVDLLGSLVMPWSPAARLVVR
ncbi:uncharacterized protein A4U43_C08F14850 [Asparagus officinalis]|nr:uncharacterized protein A4U43_C08F14850 [Asparagus officinalis]